jgi:hypothetical protein
VKFSEFVTICCTLKKQFLNDFSNAKITTPLKCCDPFKDHEDEQRKNSLRIVSLHLALTIRDTCGGDAKPGHKIYRQCRCDESIKGKKICCVRLTRGRFIK